jgi:hypothetical protein
MAIGRSHHEAPDRAMELPAPRPAFFFAPTQVKKRVQDWGPRGYQQRVAVELHEKTIRMLESARDSTAHRNAFAELAVELTNSGLQYYFIKPLKAAKAGFVPEQSASVGMVGVQQVIGTVIRNIVGRMDAPQLLSIGHSLRQFMR